jgi:alpha-beta hydrolase superfamily lysophospholipase
MLLRTVRAFALWLVLAVPAFAQLSLLDVRMSGDEPRDHPMPPAARFTRVDVYFGSAPPAGMFPEDFAGGGQRPMLVPDRDDPAPLGVRTPLVLVHGIMLKDAREPGEAHPEKAAVWDTFRRSFPAALRRHYKPYFYFYPTARGPRQAGREMAELVRGTLERERRPDAPIAVLGHSMGGLTMRYAMNEGRLGEQVRVAASLATPHHGSVLASLFSANERLKDKLGWFRWMALKYVLSITPYTRAIDEIAYDNSGHEFDPDEARRMGVRINTQLAEFNRADPYLRRVHALMADLRAPKLHFSVFKMLRYVPAYIVGPLSENFRSLDPLVHYESGSCESGSCPTMRLAGRKAYEGVDHSSIMQSAAVMTDLYALLDRSAARQP